LPETDSLIPLGDRIFIQRQFNYTFQDLPNGLYLYPMVETADLVHLLSQRSSNSPLYFDTTGMVAIVIKFAVFENLCCSPTRRDGGRWYD
jgi:hypothetical protein